MASQAAISIRGLTTSAAIMPINTSSSLTVRLLQRSDIDRLLVLEHQQWTDRQAASGEDMSLRMETWPELCIGAFCPDTGAAVASAFLRPIDRAGVQQAKSWEDCAHMKGELLPQDASRSLFGISMTSVNSSAVRSMFQFMWVQAMQRGWGEIYLGSPIPGLRRALQRNPSLDVQRYARQRRHGLPVDPQLRYYHGKGFREIVAVCPDYFPHEESLDYGAIIRHVMPFSELDWMMRQMPVRVLQHIATGLYAPAGAPRISLVKSVAEALGF